ncbi:MAG: 50S ribosomal protein L19e [Candidatus Thermoplasmatota archaeon]
MDLSYQRRVASEILKCGVNRVWMAPNRAEDIAGAVTRADIRKLIVSGAILARKKKGVSRVRARYRAKQKKKGRRRGHGKREGTFNARFPKKDRWIQTIRPIRERLKELRKEGKISKTLYRIFYRQTKGGMFKNKAHLELHLRTRGYLKE